MDSITTTTFKSMSPQLLVQDIERSLEYYILKLGFDLDFRYEDFYAGVSRDGHAIHLKQGVPSTHERANRKDLDAARQKNSPASLLDRLTLSPRTFSSTFTNVSPSGKALTVDLPNSIPM